MAQEDWTQRKRLQRRPQIMTFRKPRKQFLRGEEVEVKIDRDCQCLIFFFFLPSWPKRKGVFCSQQQGSRLLNHNRLLLSLTDTPKLM